MEGTPVEHSGNTGCATGTLDRLLHAIGISGELPPCPLWPDLN